VCGRCRRRGTICDGYHVEGTFTFFDETERAERLSREARGEIHEEGILEVNAAALQTRFSWLNDQALASIPPRLKLDATTLAVDRLFAHWIIYPNDVSPGYMHHLPLLYEKAPPNSVLQSSVRALAFADIRRTSSGGPEYRTKALQSYGAAITRLRTAAQDPADLEGDETLAALLLIDAFEVCLILCYPVTYANETARHSTWAGMSHLACMPKLSSTCWRMEVMSSSTLPAVSVCLESPSIDCKLGNCY